MKLLVSSRLHQPAPAQAEKFAGAWTPALAVVWGHHNLLVHGPHFRFYHLMMVCGNYHGRWEPGLAVTGAAEA